LTLRDAIQNTRITIAITASCISITQNKQWAKEHLSSWLRQVLLKPVVMFLLAA